MNVRQVGIPEMTDQQRRVLRASEALHRDGASPAGALELLAAIVEERTWERVTDQAGAPFTGFRSFVRSRAGLDFDPDQLPKVLELRHPRESVPDVAHRMAIMRQEVKRLLLEEISEAAPIGRPHKERGTFNKVGQSDTAEKIAARLKRDDPDLAARVVAGEITPNAAARQKGWRKPRIVVSSPAAVAAALRKYLTAEQLAEVARLLAEGGDT